MKTLKIPLIILIIFIFWACTIEETKDDYPKELVVNVERVWMLNTPLSDDLSYQLAAGDRCEILSRDKKMILHGMEDYWYKVKFNEKTGWIFGSETNLSTGIIHKVEDFRVFFQRFIEDSYKGLDLNIYLHPEIGIYGANNPGAICVLIRSMAIVNQSPPTEAIPKVFERAPKGHYCEGFEEEGGFYILPGTLEKLPSYPYFDNNGDFKNTPIKLPATKNAIVYKKVKVIIDKQFESDMYFANIDYKWYLIIEDLCDCSA